MTARKTIITLLGGLAISAGFTAAEPFNVVTYKVRFAASSDKGTRAWDARKETVARDLKESKAEIFGLQGPSGNLLSKRKLSIFPQIKADTEPFK
ncbi:MAG: hypothetical protein QNL68_03835 [Akkermansiaceae bacterium]